MQKYLKNISGDALVFASMLIFGSYILFLRFFPVIPAFMFLFAMQAIGAIGFFFFAEKKCLVSAFRKNIRLFLGLVLVTLGNDLSYFMAFRMTSGANAAFSHQMVSVFLLFFAPWFLAERTTKNEWWALIVSFIGLGVLYIPAISFRGGQTMWTNIGGIGLGTLSAVFYALLIIGYRKLNQERGLPISEINFWRFSVSTILMLPVIIYAGGVEIIQTNLWTLAAFGLLFAVIASGMHNYAIAHTRALHVSIIGKSEPIIAALYAFLWLNETPTAFILLGGALILGSSVWLAFQKENAPS